jgi:ribonuclease P protein component
MLKKRKRLLSKEVDDVLKDGQSARSTHMQLKFVALPHPLRSSAVVAKSVARKAVARNSLRRALYRAIALSDMSQLQGNAVFFVRLVPQEKPTAVFAKELPSLVASLRSKLKPNKIN